MQAGSCPKCGGGDVLDGVRLKPASGGGVDEVRAVVMPTSGMVCQETGSQLRAWVCSSCGLAELYVDDPALLAERWRCGER